MVCVWKGTLSVRLPQSKCLICLPEGFVVLLRHTNTSLSKTGPELSSCLTVPREAL